VQVEEFPVTPPDQPSKVEFGSGMEVKVTMVPAEKVVPDGSVVTLPLPIPTFVMVRL
jgi:hypothetical protein